MTSRDDVARLDHELLLALAAQAIDTMLAYKTTDGPAHAAALRRTAKIALRALRAAERQQQDMRDAA